MSAVIRSLLIVFVFVVGGCATPMRNQAQSVSPPPDALVMANACSAPANQGCTSCQISCPANMIAFCAEGRGRQVLSTGGIYVWQCWVQPACSCSYPESKVP